MRRRLLALITLASVAVAGCGQKGADHKEPKQPQEVQTQRDAGWVLEQSSDAITDASILKALKIVWGENQTFQGHFVFSCRSEKQTSYLQLEVSFFDKDDAGVAVQQRETYFLGSSLGYSFEYALRFDQDEPIASGAVIRDFSNQIILLSANSERPSAPSSVRQAKKLALAVLLDSGNPTFVTSLEDDDIGRVLDGCASTFVKTKEETADAVNAGKRVEISPNSMQNWVSELRSSGTLKQANDVLRSNGVIDKFFHEGDYSASYFKVHRNTSFLGSEVSALLLAEEKPNTMGCCSTPTLKLYFKDAGASEALSSFASKNGCSYDVLSDGERDNLMRNYGFSTVFDAAERQLSAVLECRKSIVN